MASSGDRFTPSDAKTMLAPVRAAMPSRIFSSRVMSAEYGKAMLFKIGFMHKSMAFVLSKIQGIFCLWKILLSETRLLESSITKYRL